MTKFQDLSVESIFSRAGTRDWVFIVKNELVEPRDAYEARTGIIFSVVWELKHQYCRNSITMFS